MQSETFVYMIVILINITIDKKRRFNSYLCNFLI